MQEQKCLSSTLLLLPRGNCKSVGHCGRLLRYLLKYALHRTRIQENNINFVKNFMGDKTGRKRDEMKIYKPAQILAFSLLFLFFSLSRNASWHLWDWNSLLETSWLCVWSVKMTFTNLKVSLSGENRCHFAIFSSWKVTSFLQRITGVSPGQVQVFNMARFSFILIGRCWRTVFCWPQLVIHDVILFLLRKSRPRDSAQKNLPRLKMWNMRTHTSPWFLSDVKPKSRAILGSRLDCFHLVTFVKGQSYFHFFLPIVVDGMIKFQFFYRVNAGQWEILLFCFFWFLAVSSLAPGTRIGLSAGFHKVRQSVLWPGDWRILLLCIYIPAPFTESVDRLGRRMIFKVAGAGIELNSSYKARVDPFPSTLSTRPSLLPQCC